MIRVSKMSLFETLRLSLKWKLLPKAFLIKVMKRREFFCFFANLLYVYRRKELMIKLESTIFGEDKNYRFESSSLWKVD